MSKIVLLSILSCAFAAPGFYDTHVIPAVPLAKTTLTQSSQVVDHGSTHVLHPVAPVLPLAKTTSTLNTHVVDHGSTHIVHAPLPQTQIVDLHVPLAKTTSTHSNHVVNHGGTAVLHPVHPVVHELTTVEHHPVVFPATSIYSYKTPDSAITHHSSEVHETVPYYAYH